MKAKIKHDLIQLFLYEEDIDKEKDVAPVDWENIQKWNKGDIVLIIKEVANYVDGLTGYIVYNPKNHESITVSEMFLEFVES